MRTRPTVVLRPTPRGLIGTCRGNDQAFALCWGLPINHRQTAAGRPAGAIDPRALCPEISRGSPSLPIDAVRDETAVTADASERELIAAN